MVGTVDNGIYFTEEALAPEPSVTLSHPTTASQVKIVLTIGSGSYTVDGTSSQITLPRKNPKFWI